MSFLKRIDPLIWFFLIAGILFYWIEYQENTVTEGDALSRSKKQIAMPEMLESRYAEKYIRLNGSPPSFQEIQSFRENWLREELLFREGIALELFDNDPVIRQRVIDKMRLLLVDEPSRNPASKSELVEYFESHPSRYTKTESVSFLWVDVNQTSVPTGFSVNEYQAVILSALNSGADPAQIGIPIKRYENLSPAVLRAQFGNAIYQKIKPLVASSEWHALGNDELSVLIHLYDHQPARIAPFAEVEKQVKKDFKQQQKMAAIEEKLNILAQNYSVVWHGTDP